MPAITGLAGRRAWSVMLLLVAVLGLSASALGQKDKSDPLCPHIVACQYEAPAFSIRVVDQQTGQPLSDVHAIAAWFAYDRRWGVLVALEAVSGPDGRLTFPAWGPVRSGTEGLVEGRDPIISLFRRGYRATLIHNATPIEQSFTARVHAFARAGDTFELSPFRGTAADAIAELQKAADPLEGTSLSDRDPLPFRQAYANRLRLIKAEADLIAVQSKDLDTLLWRLRTGIDFLDPGGGN